MVRLSSEPAASADELARISGAIDRWNMDVTGVRDYHQIAIFLRDDDGEIRGGISGGVWGGWLHVVGLWVDEEIRGRGFGRELVLAAEVEARAAGARRAFLETHSFQAPGLYGKLGYVAFAEIEDYPPGESQVFLRKDLIEHPADEPAMASIGIDHVVLTVRSIDRTCAFYADALGVEAVTFGDGRRALQIGRQKINLHEAGHEFEPRARRPTPGSGDVCFVTGEPLDDVLARLERAGIPIEEGPVARTGAVGSLRSVYVRDPDGNLVEIANQVAP